MKNVLEEFCMKCDRCNGTGEIKMPKNDEIFDQEFDRLDKIDRIFFSGRM